MSSSANLTGSIGYPHDEIETSWTWIRWRRRGGREPIGLERCGWGRQIRLLLPIPDYGGRTRAHAREFTGGGCEQIGQGRSGREQVRHERGGRGCQVRPLLPRPRPRWPCPCPCSRPCRQARRRGLLWWRVVAATSAPACR